MVTAVRLLDGAERVCRGLMEACRAAHGDICLSLLMHGRTFASRPVKWLLMIAAALGERSSRIMFRLTGL